MKLYKKNINYVNKKHGAVLFIAILISGVALAVGLGVFNRTYKELIISSFWKQAQTAFSAADSGLECALYWDKNPSATPECFGVDISTQWNPVTDGNSSSFFLIDTVGICVNVNIIKNIATGKTTIESRGRNTCEPNSLRIVERALGVIYPGL